jgi:DNA ligase-associated metallophosphoesterase
MTLAAAEQVGHAGSMSGQEITLAGTALTARTSGALWWAAERLLCVADLHLGRSERLARRGGALLPPYETAETLDRLAAEIAKLTPARVVCLGDSFDDDACGGALAHADAARLRALMAGRDWMWIAGNHDPAPPGLGGTALAELRHGPIAFRHAALAGAAPGEVSGHLHPKLRLPLGGRGVTRACFLLDATRLILPAFGAYTGGLRADHPALAALLGPDARAVLTGTPCVMLPLAALGARATGST